jgi:hypothetical protein
MTWSATAFMEELGRTGYPLGIDSRTTENDDRIRTWHIRGNNQQRCGGPREKRPSQCSERIGRANFLSTPNRTPGQRRAGWATRTAKASERGGVNSVTDMVLSAMTNMRITTI